MSVNNTKKYLDLEGLTSLVGQIKNSNTKIWKGTKEEYDELTEYDPQTLYCILGESNNPVQSDWNETDSKSLAFIKNKPTIPTLPELATVATSGSYDDLSDKPQLADIAYTGKFDDLVVKPINELIIDEAYYDNCIDSTDGLIKTLNGYWVTVNLTKAQFIAMADTIKFIKFQKGTRSTMFNVVFYVSTSAVVCGYCFNRLNESTFGVGYITIRWQNDEKTVSITADRSTLEIDGHKSLLSGIYESFSSWTSIPIGKKTYIGNFSYDVTLGLSGNKVPGEDMTLIMKNTSSETRTITLSAFTYSNVSSISVPSGKTAEINILMGSSNTYARATLYN